MSEIKIYAKGLVACSVCAPKDIGIGALEAEVNIENPTGIDSSWRVAKEDFKDGTKNPHECENDSTRLHYLLTC